MSILLKFSNKFWFDHLFSIPSREAKFQIKDKTLRYLTSFPLVPQENLGLSLRWVDAGSAISTFVLKNKAKPTFIFRKVIPGSCEKVKQ